MYICIFARQGYEIRRYDPGVWAATDAKGGFSGASSGGFFRLFRYCGGKNRDGKRVPLRKPVCFVPLDAVREAFQTRFFLGNVPASKKKKVVCRYRD